MYVKLKPRLAITVTNSCNLLIDHQWQNMVNSHTVKLRARCEQETIRCEDMNTVSEGKGKAGYERH